MSAPDPESFSLLSKVVAAATAVAAPIGWIYTRLDKKADKHTVNDQIQEVKTEQTVHRGYFKDVFEKLEAHQRRDEELFREVMGKMSDNHAEVLKALGGKADR